MVRVHRRGLKVINPIINQNKKVMCKKLKVGIRHKGLYYSLDERSGKLMVPSCPGDFNKEEALKMSMDTFITRYLAKPTFPHKVITLLNYYRRNKEGLELLSAKPAQFKVLHNMHYCYPYGACAQRYGNLIITLRACAIENCRTYLVYDEFNDKLSEVTRYYLVLEQNNEIL